MFDARLSQPEQEQQDVQPLRNIDQLTQLPNQRYFNQYLEIQWQQLLREGLPLSLIMCDIDYFRFYNEAYGEPAGDICLQQVASTIRSEVKHQAAVVARYGGEEFAVLLPQTDTNTAMDIAETIRESIKALAIALEYPGVGGFPDEVLTVSLGVASTVPSAQTSLEKLVDVAEDALYKAKRLGRDRVSLGSL
ncbi:MAG: GGDEF domain-containing protein [Coleofasciculus sp. S288]|nr:GGDEF domain-containing protein [Coleofasciculus sp. S288]